MTTRETLAKCKPFDVIDLTGSTPEPTTRHSCVDCHGLAPVLAGYHTMVSSRYGWRLHREVDERTGDLSYEWRCADCWEKFRSARHNELLRRTLAPPSLDSEQSPASHERSVRART